MSCGFCYPYALQKLLVLPRTTFVPTFTLRLRKGRAKGVLGTQSQDWTRLTGCWVPRGRTGIVHESPRVWKRSLTYREHAAMPQQWREVPAACRLSPLSACPSTAADPEVAGPRTASGGAEMTGVQVKEKVGRNNLLIQLKWPNERLITM